MRALQKFLLELNTETELLMDEYNTRELSFTAYVLNELSGLLNCGDPEIIHACKRDKAGRIQGEIFAYAISENQEVLTLFYTMYSSLSEVASYTNTDYQTCLNRLQGFYNLSIRGAHFDIDEDDPMYDPCRTIYDNQANIPIVNLCVLSNGILVTNETVKNLRIPSKVTNVSCWDIRKIYYQLHKETDHVNIDVDFTNEYKNFKIPFIEMESTKLGYKCILAMFPAKLLYKLYAEHNTNLLLNNVRYFLGLKKSAKKNANVGMLETLRSDESQMFLAYNNGITALAQGVEIQSLADRTEVGDIEESNSHDDFISMGVLKKIVDFRIVNGGQTTATLFHAKRLGEKKSGNSVSLYGVYVQVKIIVINNDLDRLTGNITKYSNSQSQIKYSDFSVSNEFNMAMERLSRTINVSTPTHEMKFWFFERLRGQYDNERSRNKTKVDLQFFDGRFPKNMRFKKEEIAKVWKSWNQTPYDAVKGEGTNYDLFIEDKVKTGFIPDEIYYKETIALLIIYRFLMSRPENKGYGNKKATIVAYAMAYLQYTTFGNLDLLKIWEKQSLSDNMKTYLNQLCGEILKVLDQLAENRGKTVLSFGKTKDAYRSVCDNLPILNRSLLDDDLKR